MDSPTIMSTDHGQMGKFQPYESQGRATFQAPTASMEPKQARYKDAVLMVDLAYTPVTQRGSGEPALVNGFGDGLPFTDAMVMVLPSGWQFYRDSGMTDKDVPKLISFTGGRSWPDVLKQIGERYALHFHIDWFDKTVMLSKGRASMVSQASEVRPMAEPVRAVAPAPASAVLAANTAGFKVSTAPSGTPASPAASVVAAAAVPGTAVGAPQATKSFSSQPVAAPPVVSAGTPAGKIVTAGAQPIVVAAAVAPAKPLPPAPPPPPPIPTWKVLPSDHTLREALRGWAKAAGWTFEPEHWAVPVDIPVTASATFTGDFKTATRQLIGTTELSATPLQPCFYSNKVVRVVPINEMCDRMTGR